jgi:hypothetical protein
MHSEQFEGVVEEFDDKWVVKKPYQRPFRMPVRLPRISEKSIQTESNHKMEVIPHSALESPVTESLYEGGIVLGSVTIKLGSKIAQFKTEYKCQVS